MTLPPLPPPDITTAMVKPENEPRRLWGAYYTDRAVRAYGEACAAAATAAERERCAKLCESKGPELIKWWGDGPANAACQECAAAIRSAE